VLAQRDVRTLQTEIGTRGRLAQLERWNVRVLALSAPSAEQFVDGGFELAKLVRPPETIRLEAPVVLAAAPAPNHDALAADAVEDGDIAPADGGKLLHQASLKVRLENDRANAQVAMSRKVDERTSALAATARADKPKRIATQAAIARPVAKPAAPKSVEKKSTEKNAVAAAKSVTREPKLAKADPLAPVAESKHGKTHKDSVATR